MELICSQWEQKINIPIDQHCFVSGDGRTRNSVEAEGSFFPLLFFLFFSGRKVVCEVEGKPISIVFVLACNVRVCPRWREAKAAPEFPTELPKCSPKSGS